ncbi:tRNA (guanosine(37)-N1)-methyltransferase TrmD [Candidatus Oleimmundimicrobium sp.]|uniref:tRNA (guanosine(37)-N1)-methyltransferase TrmD n=1 Tax=Candidatus Oleimmundimicrobium sp. TaxID=3060597 RepID=UPI002718FAE5|nr:tRNA (guanosine(37)-N1)-methyltransferase TrmD [Candidatus Oleimmundimicrobium sp.]MDO8885365.1 tRNA (guanosine(37)-N1)-methyltransferase TrmD [Candidatus Oleimmundimicrobium sp.]
MQIDIITIFPEIFNCALSAGIIPIALKKNILKVNVHNLRDFTHDKHKQVDDVPYGGGPGMVMKPEAFFEAVQAIAGCNLNDLKRFCRVILFTPQGVTLKQKKIVEFSKEKRLILLCPRYEGIDERVRENLVTDEVSIGDFIVSGGELPAMIFMDAVTRLLPGVLGSEMSLKEESFTDGLLEYPQYTRPNNFMGLNVPQILLSGNHAEIAKWRRKKSLERTLKKRSDLLEKVVLTEDDKKLLSEIKKENL